MSNVVNGIISVLTGLFDSCLLPVVTAALLTLLVCRLDVSDPSAQTKGKVARLTVIAGGWLSAATTVLGYLFSVLSSFILLPTVGYEVYSTITTVFRSFSTVINVVCLLLLAVGLVMVLLLKKAKQPAAEAETAVDATTDVEM